MRSAKDWSDRAEGVEPEQGAETPPVTQAEQLHRMALAFPNETAYVVVDQGRMTYAEWDAGVSRLARGLIASGVAPGDRVGVHLSHENALRWMTGYAAAHRAGGVAVPMNPRLAPLEIAHMLEHSAATALIADGPLVAQDAGVAPKTLSFIVDASREGLAGADGASVPVLAWDQFLDDDASAFQVPRTDDDLADILYTSGTTGRPKGVAVHHGAHSMIKMGKPVFTGGGWLHASPMYTFAGVSSVFNPMLLGLTGIYQPRFDATRWLEVVEELRPVAVFLVPAMAHLLLEHPRFEGADLSSVMMCSVGSAPLSPSVLERLQNRMPHAVVSNNYGMTEAGTAYCLMPQGEAVKRPGSVGKMAGPATVKIVDSEGNELPPGEVGEVRLHIPGRHRVYYNDPEATAAMWVDGWLHTGDLGKLDEDGYLYIVGRDKDVIIRGGNNIHALDVENVMVTHPAVSEVAIVGAPHAVLGEDVAAFVVLRQGATATPEELREFGLSQLADYKVPRHWYFVDELPRNATGKVVKKELRARLEEAPAS